MSDEYPTVYLRGGDTHAEFVIANPDLPAGVYLPASELRELIQQWRVKADKLIHEGSDDGVKNDYVEGRGGQLIQAANELEELIDER